MAKEFEKNISNIDLRPDLDVVSKEERIKQTPNTDGVWKNIIGLEGQRGTGKFYPTDEERIELLAKYSVDHVNYGMNAEPDFTPFAQAQVKISNMEGGTAQSRAHNFANANRKMVNTEWARQRGLKTQTDIQRYMTDNDLTWHEKSDGVTMQMVPSEINRSFGHVGGVSTISHMESDEEGLRHLGHTIAVTKVKANQKAIKVKENVEIKIEEVNLFIDETTAKFISENFAEINRAGIDQATQAVAFAAVLSITRNTISVIRGEEQVENAVKAVLIDSSSSAVIGYATGALMKKLSVEQDEAALLVSGAVQISEQIMAYMSGNIDEPELVKNVAETSAYLSFAYAGKIIGGMIGESIAGYFGAAIGQYLGEVVTTVVCSEIIDTIKFNKEFDKENARLISLYKKAECEIRNSQARLENIIQKENEELKQTFLEGFECLVNGIHNNSYEQIEKGINIVGSKFNLSQEDFRKDIVTQDTLFQYSDETLEIE